MEPEALDDFCQRKLAQLSQVPDLEWEEEKVWQNIRRQLRGGSFDFRYLSVLLILVGMLGWFILSQLDQPLMQAYTRTHATARRPTAEPDRSKRATDAVNQPDTKTQAVKNAFSRPATVDSTEPSLMVEPLASKPLLPRTKLYATRIGKTLPMEIPQPEQSRTRLRVTTDTVRANRSGSSKRKDQESYLASGGNGHVTGMRQVWHVSRRLSLVHGLQVLQPYPAAVPPEMSTALRLDYALQLPLEVRYYLLPKDKRFTVFLYADLVPSIVLSPPLSQVNRRPVDLSFQAGAEARYRLFTTKHGSSAFFFMRLPAYQRSLVPLTSSPRRHLLWGSSTF